MKKILVVDDAEFILESTATLLKFEGYDVFTAQDGYAGVEMANEILPDLILCDISMPGLDGFGVIEQIRGNALTSTIPFVFLTALAEKSDMRAGMERGADDFLVKPYTRDELIAAIEAQWNKKAKVEAQVQEKVGEVGRNVTYALPHEFRTVLNEVIGSAKYLNSSANAIAPDEIIDVSNDIMYSVNRLLKITENFIIYTRIEAYASNNEMRKQLKAYTTDEPGTLLEDILFNRADKYSRMKDAKADVQADQIKINISTESYHKILDEIIDNAFRFSSPETPVILEAVIQDSYLRVALTDQGRGMSQEQIANIAALNQFDRTIYEQQGVGLGLVIAKKLVELHDGDFNIESSEGYGTTVRFSLPCFKINID